MKIPAILNFLGFRATKQASVPVREPVEPPPFAEELADAYDAYGAGIRRLVAKGAIAALFVLAAAQLMAHVSSVDVARDNPSAVLVVLEPLSSNVALSGLGILTSLAVAMQLVVRLPRTEVDPGSRELARQQFLVNFSSLLVAVILGLSFYLVVQSIQLAGTFNLVRTLGPLGAGLLIAIIAADAGTAARPEFRSEAMTRVWLRREQALLKSAVRIVQGHSRRPNAEQRRRGLIALCLAPVVLGGIVAMLVNPQNLLMIVAAATVFSVAAYLLSSVALYWALRRDWVALGFLLVLTVAVYLVVSLGFVLAAHATASAAGGAAAPSLLGSLAILYVPYFVASFSLTKPPLSGHTGYLRYRVTAVLVRRRKRIHSSPAAAPPKPKRNHFAVLAMWCVLVPPAAIVFGRLAIEQLRVPPEPGQAVERGKTLAGCAIGAGVVLTIVGVAVVVYVWGTVPPL